jgi:hypothetical protein
MGTHVASPNCVIPHSVPRVCAICFHTVYCGVQCNLDAVPSVCTIRHNASQCQSSCHGQCKHSRCHYYDVSQSFTPLSRNSTEVFVVFLKSDNLQTSLTMISQP